jgi:hypothetical protein
VVSSTNKTDLHTVTEILLKVALNTITLTPFIPWIWFISSGLAMDDYLKTLGP